MKNDYSHSDSSEYLALGESSMILAVALLVIATFSPEVFRASHADAPPSIEIKTDAKSPPNAKEGETGVTLAQATHRWSGALEPTAESQTDGSIVVEVSPEVFSVLQGASSIKLITHKP